MTQELPTPEPTQKPLSGLATIYFSNPEKKQFFKQNSLTGGTYLECWVNGKDFTHILTTVELGTPEKLVVWMNDKNLKAGSSEEYDSHFFQFCREVDAKRNKKNEERQRQFEQSRI